MKYLSVIAIAVLMFSGTAFAESSADYTGKDLFNAATTSIKESKGEEVTAEDKINALYWTGYVTGFDDASVITHVGGKNKFVNLPANGVNPLQVMTIVHEYLSNNPEMLNESARVCLLTALGKAFPAER